MLCSFGLISLVSARQKLNHALPWLLQNIKSYIMLTENALIHFLWPSLMPLFFLGFKEHQEVFFFSLIMIKIMLHMQRADCNGIIIHIQPNFLYLKKVLVTLWWESKYWKCSHEHEMSLLLFYACIQYNSATVIMIPVLLSHLWVGTSKDSI